MGLWKVPVGRRGLSMARAPWGKILLTQSKGSSLKPLLIIYLSPVPAGRPTLKAGLTASTR